MPETDTADAPALLREMLRDYLRHAETLWTDAGPGLGYWGSGKSDAGNEGPRAVANTALAYALLAREGDPVALPIAARVDPALRYVAETHLTGGRAGTDGKQWGDSWQSAMWAGNLGVAAFLAKEGLREETMAVIRRAVTFEADRFLGKDPPEMLPGDTKAEENAWDLTAPSAALLLMPGHPNAPGWHEAVLRYGFNTLSVAADKESDAVADGRPVRTWVTTTQLFPDFTLENHDFFHPVYAMVAPATNAQAAVAYRLGGRAVPDALKHNVLAGWGMLKYITLWDGEWLYPQGLDWDLHDYEHLHYWTMLATLFRDPLAALLERRTAAYARRRQRINGDGRFVGPSGNMGFAREAIQAERVTFALLMHALFGPPPPAADADWAALLEDAIEPTRAFPWVGFAVHRAERGLFSFSWRHGLNGLVAPRSNRYPGDPYVTTPFAESLAGRFSLEGHEAKAARAALTLNRHAVETRPDGFIVAVDADVNGGLLRHEIAVATAAPGILLYLDRVTARADVTVLEERGLSVAVENDDVTGDRRRLFTACGERVMAGGEAGDYPLTGNWANVDGRLGLAVAGDAPASLLYRAAGEPNRPGAREDLLIGAHRSGPASFAAGAVVAERAGVLLPDASPEETAGIAAGLRRTRSEEGDTTLYLVGPDGREHALTLRADGTACWQGRALTPAAA